VGYITVQARAPQSVRVRQGRVTKFKAKAIGEWRRSERGDWGFTYRASHTAAALITH